MGIRVKKVVDHTIILWYISITEMNLTIFCPPAFLSIDEIKEEFTCAAIAAQLPLITKE